MRVIDIYKYERTGGGTTVSPIKPDCDYIAMFRIVADEGKALVNGDLICDCADVESLEGWSEIDNPEPEPEPENM